MSFNTSACICGIGLGPGDPELITLKAFRLIEEAELIIAPRARISSTSLARSIVEEAGFSNKLFLELEFPMITDKGRLEEKWRETVLEAARAAEGKSGIAYITLGDPGIYSTWTYFKKALKKEFPSVETRTVAGVTTMTAAGAALSRTLVKGNEKLALVPLPENLEDLTPLLELLDTVVIYKAGKSLGDLYNYLEKRNLVQNTVIGRRIGLAGQEIFPVFKRPGKEESGGLSTVIVFSGRRQV